MKGAFAIARHQTVLENLNRTICGHRIYSYILSFPTNRRAAIYELARCEPSSPPVTEGRRKGRCSLPLFEIAMMKLPEQLNSILGVLRALYAGDITLWTTTCSEGDKTPYSKLLK